MTTMLSAAAQVGAGIDAVQIITRPIPSPGPGEALIRLKAATLNYRDLIVVDGITRSAPKGHDYVPLSCGAGEVIAVGSGVTRVTPGHRVSPLYALGWFTGDVPTPDMLGGKVDGTARQYATFPADSLVLLPDELGDMDAATLPCAGLTAWVSLFGSRPIQPGEWILAQGTGGVSIAALQWAKAAGANVIVTSSSDAKLKRAKALGADIAINYRNTPDWARAVRAHLNGRGVDIVIDVAGATQFQAASSVLNAGGIIAAIGMLDGKFTWDIDTAGTRVVQLMVGNRGQHEDMLAFAARHAIRPVVDVVYDLTRLPDAMRHMKSQAFFGKIGINLL